MARSEITITPIVRSGTTPIAQTTANATDKHYIASNPGDTFLEVISTDAGSQNVTIKVGDAISTDGLTLSDLVIAIPAGATRYIGPFKPRTFRQSADSNRVYIDPAVSTTLKFRAYSLTANP